MGLPGLSRVDHIGFTVPDLAEARAFLVDVLGCEYLYSLGPFVHEDTDWMAEHLNVHPRAVMRRNSFFRFGGQAIFEVFSYEAPDQNATPPRNSDVGGHHVALYVDDLDAAVAISRARRTGARRADGEQRRRTRASAGSTSSRPGACSSSWSAIPTARRSSGIRRRSRDGVVAADVGAASARVAHYLRDAILAGEIGPASGSGRRRSPSASARAGCRCARRCASSRPRG